MAISPSPVHDANDVVASMRDNVYESITLKLGDGCTVDEIAREYNANKSFYDSMTDDHVKYQFLITEYEPICRRNRTASY